jgi:hypothetical protein
METRPRAAEMSDVASPLVVLCFLVVQARAIWLAWRWFIGLISLGDATGRESDCQAQLRRDAATVEPLSIGGLEVPPTA